MSGIEAAALHPSELIRALRAGAQKDKRAEAAIELLIRHDVWLQRPAFLATCVRITERGDDGVERLCASVDWRKALRLAERVATTATDRRVLRVAAALGGDPRRVDILASQARNLSIGTDSVEQSSPGVSGGWSG